MTYIQDIEEMSQANDDQSPKPLDLEAFLLETRFLLSNRVSFSDRCSPLTLSFCACGVSLGILSLANSNRSSRSLM